MSSCEEELRKVKAELQLTGDYLEELKKLLNQNPDTGLPVRHLVRQQIARWIRETPDKPFSFGIIRLDQAYQRIRHTRDKMNVLLYITAQRIQEVAGEGHVFQSDRSDEFLVFLPGLSRPRELKQFFTRLNEKLQEPHFPPAADLVFGCRVGAATFPDHAGSEEELFQNAEIALEMCERRKEPAFLFTQEIGRTFQEKRQLESLMSRAVQEGIREFSIVYQPLVSPEKQVLGCEALMRWNSPDRGFIPPSQFIPLAEESGLILTLGLWILYNALNQLKTWRKTLKTEIYVSINVSSVQLQNPSFVETVGNILSSLDLPPRCLHLEVTESALMEDTAEVILRLKALQFMGVRIMLDDFGTGYSSLSYLNTLPVDTLKIAKEFVDRIIEDNQSLEVVRTIRSLAKIFGLTTLAEGVETREQFDSLIGEGCDVIQGYLFSPPVPPGEFAERFLSGTGELPFRR